MSTDFIVIIPARFASTRLPGKPLLRIGNETLLENVYNTAVRSDARAVYIATDSEKIADDAKRFNGQTILTDNELASGTDRLHAAASQLNLPPEQIIVNLQGDEYNFNPDDINQVAEALVKNASASIATLCQELVNPEEMINEHVVKVVMNIAGYALYFSRSPIPCTQTFNGEPDMDKPIGNKHIGIYAYSYDFLGTYVSLEVPEIERKEALEQLRAMYHGYEIYVQKVTGGGRIEVNTEEDFCKAREYAAQLMK